MTNELISQPVINNLISVINKMLSGIYDMERFSLDFIDTVNEQADVLQSIDPEMLHLFRNYAEEIDLFEEFATNEDKRIYGYIGADEVKLKSHKLIENVKERAKTLGITIEA